MWATKRGSLTEQVRRRPYSVVLLMSRKAHQEVFNVPAGTEDGRLTDAKGRTVDFRNTVLIMTSNVGAHQIQRSTSGIGFRVTDDEEAEYQDMKRMVTDELRKTFRPEFLNRIDETMVFHALNKEHIKEIVDIMLKDLRNQLQERASITVSEAAKEVLVEEGFDPDFGARPLRRAIQRLVENPLSEEILRGSFNEGDIVMVNADKGELVFHKQEEVATV